MTELKLYTLKVILDVTGVDYCKVFDVIELTENNHEVLDDGNILYDPNGTRLEEIHIKSWCRSLGVKRYRLDYMGIEVNNADTISVYTVTDNHKSLDEVKNLLIEYAETIADHQYRQDLKKIEDRFKKRKKALLK